MSHIVALKRSVVVGKNYLPTNKILSVESVVSGAPTGKRDRVSATMFSSKSYVLDIDVEFL